MKQTAQKMSNHTPAASFEGQHSRCVCNQDVQCDSSLWMNHHSMAAHLTHDSILVGFKCCKSRTMVCLVTVCCAMILKRYGMVAAKGRQRHFECGDGHYKQERLWEWQWLVWIDGILCVLTTGWRITPCPNFMKGWQVPKQRFLVNELHVGCVLAVLWTVHSTARMHLWNIGLSKKMDGIWNRYNLKSTGWIYTFGVLKCSEKFKVLDLP